MENIKAYGKLALIYMRHSPKPEEKRTYDSLETQRAACIRYCGHMGLTIAHEMTQEFQSARKVPFMKRGGEEILALARKQAIRHVVVQRVDRIFRDVADGLSAMKALEKARVSLHFADEGGNSLNTATAVGKMLFTTRLTFAAFEPDLIAERTSDAMHRYMESMVSLNKDPPYGFDIVGRSKPGRRPSTKRRAMQLNPIEVRNLQLIHKWRNEDRLSYQNVADLLNEKGRKDASWLSRSGRRWTGDRVRKILEGAMKRRSWAKLLLLECDCPEEFDRSDARRMLDRANDDESWPFDKEPIVPTPGTERKGAKDLMSFDISSMDESVTDLGMGESEDEDDE